MKALAVVLVALGMSACTVPMQGGIGTAIQTGDCRSSGNHICGNDYSVTLKTMGGTFTTDAHTAAYVLAHNTNVCITSIEDGKGMDWSFSCS